MEYVHEMPCVFMARECNISIATKRSFQRITENFGLVWW